MVPVIGITVVLINFLSTKYILIHIAKPTESFRRFYIVAQSYSDMVALPSVFVKSICSQRSFPVPDYFEVFDENQTVVMSESECVTQGQLYMFLYTVLILVSCWTLAYDYVAHHHIMFFDEEAQDEDEKKFADNEASAQEQLLDEENKSRKSANTKKSEILSESPSLKEKQPNSTRKIVHASWEHRVVVFLKNLLKPVLVGQAVGLFIGLIKPLQDLFYDSQGYFNSVGSAAIVFSDGFSSVINLVLSITLALKLIEIHKFTDVFGNEETIGASKRTIITMAVSRMIVLPGIMYSLFSIADALGFHYVPSSDKLISFVIHLEMLTPTANTIVLIGNLIGQFHNAEIIAVSILTQYIFGIITITALTFMSLVVVDV